MITNILLSLGLIVAVFAIIVALRPDEFRIARSTTIDAPPELAFAQVNDFHRWQQMSPYAKLDPSARYSFDGPQTGPGASLAWSGNGKVGEGRMSIAESRANALVRMNLEFLKPFKANNTAEFTFEPEGERTKVTWSMSGRSGFMCKAMGLFVSVDKMCGAQFEEGLANMKAIAEAQVERLEFAR
jgi:Polyketide cyclase / dehydrase and lipid transport